MTKNMDRLRMRKASWRTISGAIVFDLLHSRLIIGLIQSWALVSVLMGPLMDYGESGPLEFKNCRVQMSKRTSGPVSSTLCLITRKQETLTDKDRLFCQEKGKKKKKRV